MKEWKNTILPISASVADGVRVLEQEALGIVLIVNSEEHLIGTVTDGDIRRGLIKQISLEAGIDQVMSTSPIVAYENWTRTQIRNLMDEHDIMQIPIIDEQGRLSRLELMYHSKERKNCNGNVFLMAGGFGTRLRPLTDTCPKPLLKVGNKPILELILESFINCGFQNFFISTHYMPELITQHFGDGSKWDININYVHEESPLGTAGAIGLLPETAKNNPLIIMNGDLLTSVSFNDLLDFHQQSGGIATMCVREYQHQIPYGVIEPDGHKIASIVEKPTQTIFVNAGIYVLSPELVCQVKANQHLDMPELLQSQIDQKRDINLFPVHEYWLDIGRMDDFERAQKDSYLFT